MTFRFGWLFIAVGASGLLIGETPASSVKASLQLERKATGGDPQVPVLGFVARSSPVGLQPVLGTSGAVVLGELIAAGENVTRLVVRPASSTRWLSARTPQSSDGFRCREASHRISGCCPERCPVRDRLAFSSDGSVAVLYSAAGQRIQVITGLPSDPQVARTLDASLFSDVPLTALAISNDAANVLAGQSDGSAGAIWLFAGDARPRRITNAGYPSAIRFFANNQDALAVTKG